MRNTARIAVVCTLEKARLPWLRHFVAHYQAQGIERFFLSIQCEQGKRTEGEATRKQAIKLVRPLGVGDVELLERNFDAMALRAHHDSIQSRGEADWFVWADLDEFQVYPRLIPDLVETWRARNITACAGLFVDRVSRSGELVRFDARRPVWGQFPVGATVTRDLVGGQIHKVVCAHASVGIKHANHDPVPGQKITWAQEIIPVHHFKWDKTVIERLKIRLTRSWKARCHWWVQTDRLYRALALNEGKIPLDYVARFDFKDDALPLAAEPYRSNRRYREWQRSGRRKLWGDGRA